MNPAHNPPPHSGSIPHNDTEMPSIEWRKLVDYHLWVDASEPLENVYRLFSQTDANFMAVVADGRTLGLCARHEIGMKLGSQYGYSLFAKTAVGDHLLKASVMIAADQSWFDVVQQVFNREKDHFSHDIALLDEQGGLLGLISVRTLVQLQTRLLVHSLDRLQHKQLKISQQNRQLTDDLKMAREVQLAMLPQHPPKLVAESADGKRSISIHTHYAPLGLVSGDFYEVLVLSETRVCVLIADVMGHGVQAALVTAMIRALIQDHKDIAGDPGHFLATLNRNLCGMLQDSHLTLFASALAVVVDLKQGTLHYANAGHPQPIWLRPGTEAGRHIDCDDKANGGLLGILADTDYPTAHLALGQRDVILLYSDGLFEVRGNDEEMLGQEGLLHLARRYAHHPAQRLAQELVRDVHEFSPHRRFEDDVCLVIVEVGLADGR